MYIIRTAYSIFVNVHLIPPISFYLSEVWSNMTKQRVPNKISEFNTSMHEVIPPGMREDWCPVCQLHLSSQIVAISHYKGKPFYKYFCLPLLSLYFVSQVFNFLISYSFMKFFRSKTQEGVSSCGLSIECARWKHWSDTWG